MRIYVASSWRNVRQLAIVDAFRKIGHDVYDFRHPFWGYEGFDWQDIDLGWRNWSPDEYRQALNHQRAEAGFGNDFRAMKWADILVLVLPCGRSAHLEAGWAIGQGKPTCILLDDDSEPELMYKLADCLALDLQEVLEWIEKNDRNC